VATNRRADIGCERQTDRRPCLVQVRDPKRPTDNVRHNISQSVDHAKEKGKTKIDEFKDRHSG
jgi:hypothetical protein